MADGAGELPRSGGARRGERRQLAHNFHHAHDATSQESTTVSTPGCAHLRAAHAKEMHIGAARGAPWPDARRTYRRKLRRRRSAAQDGGHSARLAGADLIVGRESERRQDRPGATWQRAPPGLCIGAGRGGSRCRVERAVPGECPARAGGPCGRRGCGRHAGWCSSDAQ